MIFTALHWSPTLLHHNVNVVLQLEASLLFVSFILYCDSDVYMV